MTQCEKETKKRGFKVRNGGAERVEKENERVEKEKERVEKENERVEKENERVGSFRGGFFRVGSSPEGKRTAEKKRFFLKREKTVKLTRGRCNGLPGFLHASNASPRCQVLNELHTHVVRQSAASFATHSLLP